MSASDDYSECSNLVSPKTESPYSSPSQQMPHITNAFSVITCEDVSMYNDGRKRPYLRIVEQPQNYFRFRYKSEMVGTHGCLLGKSTTASKNKTHPTVELANYSGKALIRCRLSQADKDDEHPHKLFEDEQEDRDVSTVVPEQGSYKVGFAGMGIIHTAKKDVPGLLFKKYLERLKNVNSKDLRTHCENTAKSINLNIVRLRFSAHDLATDEEICPPVFSEPIHNMKSAAVNDLKICRISRYFGRPRGGDDVFILVEKVNKKNIIIRFYELNEQGEEVWSAVGNFLLSDVHHQYAIVFRTPPYRDPHITKDVKVFIELQRPSDGRTSEPKEFVYRADQIFKHNKRKRINSNFSSFDSSSGGSIKSMSELPTTVEMMNQNNDRSEAMPNLPHYQIQIPPVPMAPPAATGDLIAEALFSSAQYGGGVPPEPTGPPVTMSPMFGQPNIPEPPVITLNSTEIERLISHNPLPSEERRQFYENDWTEYMQSFGESLPDKSGSMDFLRSSMQLVADSGRKKVEVKKETISPVRSPQSDSAKKVVDKSKANNEYQAFYKAEDGIEVRKLVKEICELIKNKNNKQIVKGKLEKMFDMRLSNGDTFLHMTLSSNQPSFEFIVRLIHSMKMPHLLNLSNDLQQTILHLAVMTDMPNTVKFLVANGCDPMVADKEGNNVVHYAVECQSCLEQLLTAIELSDVACDLNAYNLEKQTALHVAALGDSESSVRLLIKHGASRLVRDCEGRTPLHLAVAGDNLPVVAALLQYCDQNEVNAIDGRGNTPLHIACNRSVCGNSVQLAKLLLEKKADPLKHEANTEPPWRLAMHQPQMWDMMQPYMPANIVITDEEIKSEPEDDFESADEGESQDSGLQELSLYIDEVSALLDASGAWQQLARRLHADALLSWYAHCHSPTRTLLNHLKETGEGVTSRSLAMCLQDMGEADAANVIKKYINE